MQEAQGPYNLFNLFQYIDFYQRKIKETPVMRQTSKQQLNPIVMIFLTRPLTDFPMGSYCSAQTAGAN